MLHLNSLDAAQEVIKALSAPMRIELLKLLYQNPGMSMCELADALQLTNSAISLHTGKLADAGLIQIKSEAGKHGTLKKAYPCFNHILLDLPGAGLAQTMQQSPEAGRYYQDDIRIGYFTACSITPTCGLATPMQIIGNLDDPNAFSFPEHFDCDILWFTTGYVEYGLPNHLQPGQKIRELQISFEISSEYPGVNSDYPSDIHFSINGTALGYWTSPGDYGDRMGKIVPSWWPDSLNQYGLLKTLTINGMGTFMDSGQRISAVTIDDLNIDSNSRITFRVAVPGDADHCGGCTLFGEQFGDYRQAIRVKTFY